MTRLARGFGPWALSIVFILLLANFILAQGGLPAPGPGPGDGGPPLPKAPPGAGVDLGIPPPISPGELNALVCNLCEDLSDYKETEMFLVETTSYQIRAEGLAGGGGAGGAARNAAAYQECIRLRLPGVDCGPPPVEGGGVAAENLPALQVTLSYIDRTDVGGETRERRLPVKNAPIIVHIGPAPRTPGPEEEVAPEDDPGKIKKIYTDENGKAGLILDSDTLGSTDQCHEIRFFICYTDKGCGFGKCFAAVGLNISNYPYGSIDDIPLASGAKTPAGPQDPAKTRGSFASYTYCPPPPPIGTGTPAFCLPLVLIFAFLGGAMYLTGRNPLSVFDFSAPRMSKYTRYTARTRGISFDTGAAARAVSSVSKMATKEGREQIKKEEKASSGFQAAVRATGMGAVVRMATEARSRRGLGAGIGTAVDTMVGRRTPTTRRTAAAQSFREYGRSLGESISRNIPLFGVISSAARREGGIVTTGEALTKIAIDILRSSSLGYTFIPFLEVFAGKNWLERSFGFIQNSVEEARRAHYESTAERQTDARTGAQREVVMERDENGNIRYRQYQLRTDDKGNVTRVAGSGRNLSEAEIVRISPQVRQTWNRELLEFDVKRFRTLMYLAPDQISSINLNVLGRAQELFGDPRQIEAIATAARNEMASATTPEEKAELRRLHHLAINLAHAFRSDDSASVVALLADPSSAILIEKLAAGNGMTEAQARTLIIDAVHARFVQGEYNIANHAVERIKELLDNPNALRNDAGIREIASNSAALFNNMVTMEAITRGIAVLPVPDPEHPEKKPLTEFMHQLGEAVAPVERDRAMLIAEMSVQNANPRADIQAIRLSPEASRNMGEVFERDYYVNIAVLYEKGTDQEERNRANVDIRRGAVNDVLQYVHDNPERALEGQVFLRAMAASADNPERFAEIRAQFTNYRNASPEERGAHIGTLILTDYAANIQNRIQADNLERMSDNYLTGMISSHGLDRIEPIRQAYEKYRAIIPEAAGGRGAEAVGVTESRQSARAELIQAIAIYAPDQTVNDVLGRRLEGQAREDFTKTMQAYRGFVSNISADLSLDMLSYMSEPNRAVSGFATQAIESATEGRGDTTSYRRLSRYVIPGQEEWLLGSSSWRSDIATPYGPLATPLDRVGGTLGTPGLHMRWDPVLKIMVPY